MPTAEYIKAINLLNSKCEKNWGIAIDLCTESERNFIREAVVASECAQDGFKEITLRKCEDGILRRHHHIYKFHPDYSNVLVSNKGTIFKVRDKVYENDSEIIYTVNRTRRSTYNHSGNPTVSILGMPVLVKNIVYDTFVGGRKKKEIILNINGDKRDNRLSNLKIETPMDRLMKNDLYQHLNEIVEMQKRNVKLEFIAGKFEVTRNALVWFLYKARKLGVVE